MSYTLSTLVSAAAVAFGKSLGKGADTRREFCVAMVGEIVGNPDHADAILSTAKAKAGYDLLEASEQALYRKQVQYIVAIVGGWASLSDEQREQFVGGGLPASSLVKAIQAPAKAEKAATKAATDKAEADAKEKAEREESDRIRSEGRSLITPAELMQLAANWLDSQADASGLSKAEAKAVMAIGNAYNAFRDRVADGMRAPADATTPVKKLAKAA